MIPLLLLTVMIIFLVEGMPLMNKGLWRELGTLGFLLGSAVYLGIAKLLEIPTPIHWLGQLLGPVGEMILK